MNKLWLNKVCFIYHILNKINDFNQGDIEYKEGAEKSCVCVGTKRVCVCNKEPNSCTVGLYSTDES